MLKNTENITLLTGKNLETDRRFNFTTKPSPPHLNPKRQGKLKEKWLNSEKGMNNPFFLIFSLLFVSGCRYKSNDSRLQNHRVLYIQEIYNQSLAPQLGHFLNSKVREHIIRRGHFGITSDVKECDLIMSVTVNNYRQDPEIYNPEDTLQAAGFNLLIQAEISLFNRKGEVIIDKEILYQNASVLSSSSRSNPSDRQAIVSLSDSLGRNIAGFIENHLW